VITKSCYEILTVSQDKLVIIGTSAIKHAKNHQKYDLTQQTTKHVILLVQLGSLVVQERQKTLMSSPDSVKSL